MKVFVTTVTLIFCCLHLCTAQHTVGLFENDSSSFNGYTLFTPQSNTNTYMIDNCGLLINSWSSNYRPGLSVYFLEDGSLLRTARRSSGTFSGGGTGGRIEKFDWSGNLIWSYDVGDSSYWQHHDIEPMPNGNILVVAWESKTGAEAISQGRDPSALQVDLWPETIIEIEPIGTDSINVVWQWHVWDHLIQDFDSTKNNYGVVSGHPELIDVNFHAGIGSDWIHMNGIDYNPLLDQIIMSSRALSEIWVIDHSTTTTEAASHSGGNSGMGGDLLFRWGNPVAYDRGTAADQKLFGQHNAEWIPMGYPDEGKISVFNNGAGRPTGNYSSLEVIDPPINASNTYTINPGSPFGPVTAHYTYFGDTAGSFFSQRVSGVQQQANGNFLICEGDKGNFFEIDENENIVWHYVNPVNAGGPVNQGTVIQQNNCFRAERYASNYPGFNGLNLSPGNPIEGNPLPSNCVIYSAVFENTLIDHITILNNPVTDLIQFRNTSEQLLDIEVVDMMGKFVHKSQGINLLFSIPVTNYSPGIYLLSIYDKKNLQVIRIKILKQ